MKHKRRELMGVIGALGAVVALAGFVGGWIAVRDTIVWTLGVWTFGIRAVGATLVLVFTDPPDKSRHRVVESRANQFRRRGRCVPSGLHNSDTSAS